MPPEAAARLRPLHWPLAFAALALVYLGPLTLHPGWIAYPPGSPFTDLLINHLPNAEYVQVTLAHYGQVPLWNTQSFAGQPFAADPLAGLWYPPAWPALAWPLPFTFNLLMALHVAWGGWGLFRLLQAEGLEAGPATLGGAAWAGAPKLVAHLGAGHVSLIFAIAWTPWLLLSVRRAARQGGLWRGAVAGAILGLTFLADPRWAFYAGWLAAGYWVGREAGGSKLEAGKKSRVQRAPTGSRVERAASADGRRMTDDGSCEEDDTRGARGAGWKAVAAAGLFGGLVSGGLGLPLWEFMRLSNRAAMTAADAALYSLPPVFLLGLVIPPLGGFHEWMTYAGVFPLLLAAAGMARRRWFWAGAAALAGMLALGTNFFLYPLLVRMAPGLGWLRVPSRAWFVVALALCALAGHGAQALLDWWPSLTRRYAAMKVRLPAASAVLAGLTVLTVLDLMRVDYSLLDVRPRPGLNRAAAWLKEQPGLFRVYSPSYSLPPGDGLEHIDGVDPLQLANSVAFLAVATGVRDDGYSVTLPPFAEGDVATVNAGAQPDAERLGQLNVRYLAAEFALSAPGLRPAQTFGTTRVYENEAWRPRAWLDGAPTEAPVITLASPNRIVIRAAGPRRLVLSEIAYPGWQADVDGRRTPIETEAGLLRAVTLGPGEHEVVFSFRPATVYVGAGLASVAAACLLGLAVARWRSGKRL